MRRNFPADTASLYPVREFIRHRAEASNLRENEVEDLVLAVSDACALLLRHSLDTVIDLSWEVGGGDILITVEDRGEIRVWAEESRIVAEETSLIAELVDGVTVRTMSDDGRTCIRMHKHLDPGRDR